MRRCPWLRRFVVVFSGAVLASLWCGVDGGVPAWAEVRSPHGVAVIIGNRVYRNKDIPPVDYAHRDAEAFKRYVVQVRGYDPANVIHLKDATRAQMQNVLGHRTAPMNDIQARLNMLDVEGGSEVIVYYSGHGVPAEKGTPSLLPVDVAPHAAQAEGYPIELLYEKLGQLQAVKSVQVFLDTCFSGSSHGGPLVTGSPVYVVAGLPGGVAERMTVLTAVTKTQIATWDKEARHSLFTHHLLDALYGRGDRDKDGKVTAAEAKSYLDRHMTSAAWITNRRVQQATLRGAGEVVLASAAEGQGFPARPGLGEGSGAAAAAKGEARPAGAPEADGMVATPAQITAVVPAPKQPDHAAAEAALGLDRDARALVQRGLAELNLAVGYADGWFGKKTRGAIREWQEGKGMAATGYLTGEQAEVLAAVGKDAVERAARAEREQKQAQAREQARLAQEAAERERLAREAKAKEAAERRAREEERPGREFRDCGECPEMVVVPAGEYLMGSRIGEGHNDERPRHRVGIGEAFAVGKYEVTFDEWEACVADGGCGGYRPGTAGWGRGRRPVVNVSWEDAKEFVRWLSERTGERYRLLSEAEWEYAARAGTRGPFHYGGTISTDEANYNGNYTYGSGSKGEYRRRTVRVESFGANGFGLHDVHGNVWEWVEDCWHDRYSGAPADGSAWVSGGDCRSRVLRGGSWDYEPRFLRSAYRLRFTAGSRNDNSGFRVARTLTP